MTLIFNNNNYYLLFKIEIAAKWPSLNTIIIFIHFTELFHFYIDRIYKNIKI